MSMETYKSLSVTEPPGAGERSDIMGRGAMTGRSGHPPLIADYRSDRDGGAVIGCALVMSRSAGRAVFHHRVVAVARAWQGTAHRPRHHPGTRCLACGRCSRACRYREPGKAACV